MDLSLSRPGANWFGTESWIVLLARPALPTHSPQDVTAIQGASVRRESLGEHCCETAFQVREVRTPIGASITPRRDPRWAQKITDERGSATMCLSHILKFI